MEDVPPQILVVEDNLLAQMIQKKIIEKFNCVVTVAKDGTEALQLLENNSYNLVFMDIGLPDIDGLRVTELLRSRSGINQSVPIVALTSNDNYICQNNAAAVGMDYFLAKPLTPENCEKILEKYSLLNGPENMLSHRM